MKYSKTSVAVAVSCALASGMATATTMDYTYNPQGKVDLSDFDNVLIVNVNKGTALSSSQPFELGIDKTVGKIELKGESGVFLSGGSGSSMTADTINITSTGSNHTGLSLYAPLTLTGNTINIDATYNAVQMGEPKNGSLTIRGGNVTISSKKHVALHGVYRGTIDVEADNLTITAPKVIQVMDDPNYDDFGASVKINAKKAYIDGDIVSRGKDGKVSVSFEEGTLKGRVNETGSGSSSTTITLGEKATWILTNGNPNNGKPPYGGGNGDSSLTNLTVNGVVDMSQVDKNITVTKSLQGNGQVVMDVDKTNVFNVSKADTKQAVITAVSSQNADHVTTAEAVKMVDRLVGVTNKSGFVEEGMYQGAITVNGSGQATQAKNDLIGDTLELASASTLSLNRILMNDVRKRLGDIRSAEEVNGVWARYDGGRLSGEGTKNKFNTIHVGGDTMPFADMPVRVGVAASYTNGDVDYTRGDADLDAYSLAAYGTWMNDNGMFADVIARVAKAESDMTVDSIYKGKLKNMAYSLSGEFGWRFDLNNMFYAEPQVEATYTYIDSDKLTLAGKGETYNYGVESFDSFIGRMGVLAGMKCPNQKGDVYVRASVVHEFLGDAAINGGNVTTLERDGKDTWFEYGIGANFNVGKNTYLWADLERTAGALVDEDIRGTLGVRFGF